MTQVQTLEMPEVYIDKLVYGGRGLGELADGKKIFVWNALPGETVSVRKTKSRRGYDEGIAEKVIKGSLDREIPKEINYLATSPWQMTSFEAENRYKKDITLEIMNQQKVQLPTIKGTTHDTRMWHYRNKMEYSFSGDEGGLNLAVHDRNSHNLIPIRGSVLAMPAIDEAANSMCVLLGKAGVKARDLKSIVIRCTQNGTIAASLFVLNKSFPRLDLPKELKGLRVHYSNPTGSRHAQTKKLYEIGDCTLEDELLGHSLRYDVDSFFQINLPVFELALNQIKTYCQADEIVDMYAGVGSIGLNVTRLSADLIEVNSGMARMARINAELLKVKANVLEASTENALDYIVSNKPIIFDPPRSGLHDSLISKILDIRPLKLVYLSCNPATQARDLYRLQSVYDIKYFEIFNFFPRTPEIETLAILAPK